MGQRAEYSDEPDRRGPRHRHGADRIDHAAQERRTDLERDLRRSGRGRPADREEWLLSFSSDATPLHPGDAPRGWRHWRGQLRVNGAVLESIAGTDFANPTTQHLEYEPDRNGARFATNTRGDASSLRMTLSGIRPSASITLDLEEARETGSAPPFFRPPADIPGRRVRLTRSVREASAERCCRSTNYPDDRVTLRRLIRNGPRDVTLQLHRRGPTDRQRRSAAGRLLLRPGAPVERRDGLVEPGLDRRLSVAVGLAFRTSSPRPRDSTPAGGRCTHRRDTAYCSAARAPARMFTSP